MALLAEQTGSSVVRQAMLGIHVEIVLAEQHHEFPHGAVVVFGNWLVQPVDTFGYKIHIGKEPLPCPSSCFSRLSRFADVAVVHKPRLEVAPVDE